VSEDKLQPPEATLGDHAHAAGRSLLGAIPFAGQGAIELFNALVTPPIERRRDEWREEIAVAIAQLIQQDKTQAETLRDNPVFIDTVLQASHIALRSSQDEKRRALRNAILNAALPSAPDQSLQQMFLSYVDAFTVWHLRLLDLFDDPVRWAERNGRQHPEVSIGGALSMIVERHFPDLRERREFTDQVWRDLYLRGLANTEQLHTTMTAVGLASQRTTDAGRAFLAFIRDPEKSRA